MNRILILLFFFSSTQSFAQSTDTAFYSVVNLGQIIGENKAWKTAANEYHYYFYFNDRGRGSVVNATVQTGAGGRIEKLTADGLDYYKAPFTSSFQKVGDSLVKCQNNKCTSYPDQGQFYDYGSVPSSIELFMNALRASPNHKVSSIYGDTILLKQPVSFKLKAHSKNLTLLLCEISYGKNSSPIFTWMDEDFHFFGDVSGWMPTIKKGYEYLVDTLYALQEEKGLYYYKSLYKKLSDTLPNRLAIENVTIFDAPNATTKPHCTVLIEHGMITAVGDFNTLKIPSGFVIIKGEGKTMLPGLWDTHAHYDKENGIAYLSGGVTHVRDMGNMPIITQIQKNIRTHQMLGPDISYLSGFIDKDDEYHGPVGKLVHTKTEAINAVNYFGKAQYNQIKIYSSIDTSWVHAMCTEAHKLHMRVAGHIPWHYTATQAVNAGYDEITHMNMVMFNFYPDTIDTRKNRIKPIGQLAYTIQLNSPEVHSLMTLLKEKKTVVEPTMNIYNEMFYSFIGDTTAIFKPIMSWIPEDQRKEFLVTSFMDDSTQIPAYKNSYKRMMEMLKLLYDNKISLLAGTDGGNQLALENELMLFAEAGIPANEVLKIATYNPANIFNLSSTYGSIQANRIADFILVDGNPVQKMSDIRRVFMVVTNHSLYYPKKLYKYSGWDYYY